ncbi:MAG: hypothetical protein DBO99_02815 [gamma proteobacterium symbiont of Ctena orbiculata]|nr:MAG: hypothetical protein DBO99_02815 [gamma proteobacterium symbiont of Ctena orbiculata]
MIPGSIFFDTDFHFHDGSDGEKLFIILGSRDSITVTSKTTSQQHGRGTAYGCQPEDRFHNFYLPQGSCHLKKCTWICLDEFYELSATQLLQKRFNGSVNHICNLPVEMIKPLQQCALDSLDITSFQKEIIRSCLASDS